MLKRSDLKIMVVGPDSGRYNVGESVTELGSHYLKNRLKLIGYLFRSQLHKGGLRFFYDSENHDADITTLSEQTVGGHSKLSTFHIDRNSIDRDIKVLNKNMGVKYLNDVVKDVRFFKSISEVITGKKTLKTKWILDGSGRQTFLRKKLNLEKSVSENYHCSVWGHFKSKNFIDLIDDEWNRKTGFATREFSTVHFFYDGYWFWVIPVKNNIISCGVVYDQRKLFKKNPPNKKEFISFIKKHKALDSIFKKENLVNFRHLLRYSYTSKKYISIDKRFALIGDAGAFIDPLYSSGLDIVAQESDFYVDTIISHLYGKDSEDELRDKVISANCLIESVYNNYAKLVLGKNVSLGSSEIFAVRYMFEFFYYYLYSVWPYLSNSPLTQVSGRGEGKQEIVSLIADNFNRIAEFYLDEGLYYRKNINWTQPASHGLYIYGSMDQKINKRIVNDQKEIFDELTQFTLLNQLELFQKRKDLTFDSTLVNDLSFASMTMDSMKRKKQDFLSDMSRKIRKREAKSPFLFWKDWLGKAYYGVSTRHSGLNYSKIKEGMPVFSRSPVDIPTYPDSISSIIRIFKECKENTKFSLSQLNKNKVNPHLKPFFVEALATTLISKLKSCAKVESTLAAYGKGPYRDFVYAGCGFGSLKLNPDRIFSDINVSNQDIQMFMDGYGFAMGIASYFNKSEIYFPRYPQRKCLVHGLGRSVTFFPNEKNIEKKFEKYFDFFGLYPEDFEEYYKGVGFSLAFTKTAFEIEKWSSERLDFKEDKIMFTKKGIESALKFRNSLFPDVYDSSDSGLIFRG